MTTPTIDSIAIKLTYPDAIGEAWPSHDLLSELVWTLPGLQTVEAHVDGDVGHEQPYALTLYIEPNEISTVQLSLHQLLAEQALTVAMDEPRPIAREDWANAWKQFWQATPIAPNGQPSGLVIVPTWESYTPAPGETVITLDPGAAFGTGTHPTTHLVLAELATLARGKDSSQQRLLDVGCGSGILAIAAAKLGCRDIVAIDVDDKAARATDANARLNNVHHAITASTTALEDLCLTPVDGAVMNIHWPILAPLILEVAKRLVPNGWLLISGLIDKTVENCAHACEEAGLTVTERHTWQGWWVLVVEKL